MNTLETPLTAIETEIKEVSTKIHDFSRELCLLLVNQRPTTGRIRRRQLKQHRRLATKILQKLGYLSQLRRKARAYRKQYRQQASVITQTGIVIKEEPIEDIDLQNA